MMDSFLLCVEPYIELLEGRFPRKPVVPMTAFALQSTAATDPKQPLENFTGRTPIRLVIATLLLVSSFANAAEFTGNWEVVEVIENDEFPWHEEIKYPAIFNLTIDGEAIVGSYTDQHGFECEFELSQLINDGQELLLSVCGTTKHSSSWAPIHKVKMEDGRLHGVVVTFDKKFEWYAEKVKE